MNLIPRPTCDVLTDSIVCLSSATFMNMVALGVTYMVIKWFIECHVYFSARRIFVHVYEFVKIYIKATANIELN